MNTHHPWLDALIARPEEEVEALIKGYAEVPPWSSGDAWYTAKSVLFGLDRDSSECKAFDIGCSKLLTKLNDELSEYEVTLIYLEILYRIILQYGDRFPNALEKAFDDAGFRRYQSCA